MTTKEYLEQYLQWQARKLNKQAECELIVIEEALPPGIDYSADRVQTSPDDSMVKKIERIMRRKRKLDKEIDELTAKMEQIRDEVNLVEDADSCRLLWLRYIEDLHWNEVAEVMYISEDYAKGALHDRALSLFGQIKGKNFKHNTK